MTHAHNPHVVDNFQNAHAQHDGNGIFNGPVPLARGRQARDPAARTITYHVASLDDFETMLREYLTTTHDEPEHTDCQLSFWPGTVFLVPTAASRPTAQ